MQKKVSRVCTRCVPSNRKAGVGAGSVAVGPLTGMRSVGVTVALGAGVCVRVGSAVAVRVAVAVAVGAMRVWVAVAGGAAVSVGTSRLLSGFSNRNSNTSVSDRVWRRLVCELRTRRSRLPSCSFTF